MSESLQPLSGLRQKKETDIAVIACNDWLRLGSGRTLRKLLDHYQLQSTRIKRFNPPTDDIGTLKFWSTNYSWQDRASAYDAQFEEMKNQERMEAFNHELALDFGRVRKLFELAQFLEGQIYEHDDTGKFYNIWNPDVKQIGSGDSAERVDIERFNPALISEYRATLADIAKEVGGRVEKKEVTGANGGAIIIKTGMSLDDL